jgi:hypothetical protein
MAKRKAPEPAPAELRVGERLRRGEHGIEVRRLDRPRRVVPFSRQGGNHGPVEVGATDDGGTVQVRVGHAAYAFATADLVRAAVAAHERGWFGRAAERDDGDEREAA